MRYHAHFLPRAGAAPDEQVARGVGHHDHELRLVAHGFENLRLVRGRFRQDRVQRDDERLGELLGERRHVLAVAAAEDPVFVLKQDDVDVEPPQDAGRAHVIATHPLGNRRHEARTLRPRRLVHDHDLLDSVDPVDAKERATHVGGKGADPTRARGVG